MFETRARQPVLTILLIAICVAIALLSNLGKNQAVIANLLISEYRGQVFGFLPEVRAGQYWRLITPIFLHFGVVHILFNSLWLWELGSAIERTSQPWKLGALVLVIGLVSNLAQYLYGGPYFGGMSGVVYGLLGYIWAEGRFNPRPRLVLNPYVMAMMLAWFALCWTGVVGRVANMAHTMGLVTGLGWAWLAALRSRSRRIF